MNRIQCSGFLYNPSIGLNEAQNHFIDIEYDITNTNTKTKINVQTKLSQLFDQMKWTKIEINPPNRRHYYEFRTRSNPIITNAYASVYYVLHLKNMVPLLRMPPVSPVRNSNCTAMQCTFLLWLHSPNRFASVARKSFHLEWVGLNWRFCGLMCDYWHSMVMAMKMRCKPSSFGWITSAIAQHMHWYKYTKHDTSIANCVECYSKRLNHQWKMKRAQITCKYTETI